MNKTYIISDTHFYDERIISYEDRPFKDCEDMRVKLISNWNQIVDESDTVFHLGDFASEKCSKELLKELIFQLNGKKILILGNHDLNYSCKEWQQFGFDQAIAYPIIYDNFFMFSHNPLYINNKMPYANIFGHVHNNPAYKTISSQSYCVCADRIDFKPLDFQNIKQSIIKKIE